MAENIYSCYCTVYKAYIAKVIQSRTKLSAAIAKNIYSCYCTVYKAHIAKVIQSRTKLSAEMAGEYILVLLYSLHGIHC